MFYSTHNKAPKVSIYILNLYVTTQRKERNFYALRCS